MMMTDVAGRRAWIDAVRALCVIAIVLLHFQIWVFDPTMRLYPNETRGLYDLSAFLGAFRMPALFVVSGLLVSRRVRLGWKERRNAVRAVSSYYLYAVWVVMYAVLAAIWYRSPDRLQGMLTQLVVPHATLWFILFLAINVVVMTTLHRVHPALVLGALVALSVWMLSVTVESPWDMLGRGAYYMLFFAIGVYFKPALDRFAAGGLWWKIPAFVVLLWVTIDALAHVPYREAAWFALFLARDIAAVVCAVAVAATITLLRPIAVLLSYIGRRTLVIYVLHVPLIWVVVSIRNRVAGETFDVAAALVFAPVVIVPAIIASSMVIGNLLKRSRVGRALFRMPRRVEERILNGGSSELRVLK